jgi:hypothetical protein
VLAKNDLKLAMKRIEDLQTAINGELDSDSDSMNRFNFYSLFTKFVLLLALKNKATDIEIVFFRQPEVFMFIFDGCFFWSFVGPGKPN